MIAFRNISLFPEKSFGIYQLSFELYSRQRMFLQFQNAEQTKHFSWLMTGKIKAQSGIFEKDPKTFIQSDRWWTQQERLEQKTAETWLNFKIPYIYADHHKKSKYHYTELLNAKPFLFYPIYRLKGEDRLHFTLLSLLFQQSGVLVLTEIWEYLETGVHWDILKTILSFSPASIIIADSKPENPLLIPDVKWNKLQIEPNQNPHGTSEKKEGKRNL